MSQANLPFDLLEPLSNQQPPIFEYGILDAEAQMVVQQRTNEIKTLIRRTSQDIIAIGQKLIEVKQHLGHGSFINWLKSEFSWSVSTANKFMQVGEQFKFVKFTNLNITASALYLVAAPSTPKEARAEVLERATLGENISYTKAKTIVWKHKKIAKTNLDELDSVDVSAKTKKCNSCKSIEPARSKTSVVFSRTENLIGKEVNTETFSRSSPDSLPFVEFEDKQIATNITNDCYDTVQTRTDIENLATTYHKTSDAVITEIAVSIKKMTPEQLALVIIKIANSGLSERHLEAIITASQQVLKVRQIGSLSM